MSNPSRNRNWVARCAGIVLLFCGCSGPKTAPVGGQITLDGRPLADVRVLFQPQKIEGVSDKELGVDSYGLTDADGKYTLKIADTDQDGAVVGPHKVFLNDKTVETDADGGPVKTPKPRFPSRYSDGSQTFEVKPGPNAADFDLKSK